MTNYTMEKHKYWRIFDRSKMLILETCHFPTAYSFTINKVHFKIVGFSPFLCSNNYVVSFYRWFDLQKI